MTDGDLRFKQAFWDKHGIMRKMEETMTAEQIKNYGSSLKELENRKSIRAVCPFCLYVGTLDKFTVLRDNKKIQVNLEFTLFLNTIFAICFSKNYLHY